MKTKMNLSMKALAALLAAVLMFGGAIGGTVAWLATKADPVVNTFTYGDIDITLTETTGDNYKIIPGTDISKDPKVTVDDGSEDCYLFVKIEESTDWPAFVESDNTTLKVNYEIAEGWTALTDVDNVYYRVVLAKDDTKEFAVLANNQVTVSENLTKSEVGEITTKPTLTFTAYAVQKENISDASTAWTYVPQ